MHRHRYRAPPSGHAQALERVPCGATGDRKGDTWAQGVRPPPFTPFAARAAATEHQPPPQQGAAAPLQRKFVPPWLPLR